MASFPYRILPLPFVLTVLACDSDSGALGQAGAGSAGGGLALLAFGDCRIPSYATSCGLADGSECVSAWRGSSDGSKCHGPVVGSGPCDMQFALAVCVENEGSQTAMVYGTNFPTARLDSSKQSCVSNGGQWCTR